MRKIIDSKVVYDHYLGGDADKLDIAARIVREEKVPEAYETMHDAFENYLDRVQAASFQEGYEYAMYLMQSS